MQPQTQQQQQPYPYQYPSSQRPLKKQQIGFYRRFHFAFLFLFSLFSCLFIIGCAIWVNYRAIFQSGLIGFFHILTGVLIGLYITSNVVEEFTEYDNTILLGNDREKVRSNLELLRQKREYAVFKRGAASTILICIIAIALSTIYLYNLFYIIVKICPTHHHDIHFTPDSISSSSSSPSSINIYMTYDHTPNGEYYEKKNVLIMKYDTTSKQIERRVKHKDPNTINYNKWFIQNEMQSYKTGKIKDNTKNHTDNDNHNEDNDVFCMSSNTTIYSWLENEITHILYKNLKDRYDQSSFRMSDKYKLNVNNEDEEDMDLHLLTRKICRNEYAFVILIIVFLILWIVLSIVMIGYNIWLLRA